jgi:CoA:oxalate CoA-transferase
MSSGLLEGYAAIDLTDLMGQFCGKILADLGMQVIKVEPLQGDPVRGLGPFKDDVPHPERSLRFAYLNAGKQSIALDLDRPAGRELLLALAGTADVLVESSAPKGESARELDEADFRTRCPNLVWVSLTGFGTTGPLSGYIAPDLIAAAMGGLMYISGDPDLPPCRPPETQSYYYAGMYGALSALLGLWSRQPGEFADLSVQEAVASQEHLIRSWLEDGKNIERAGSQHKSVVPAGLFRTQDGYVYLFASRYHWPLLLESWDGHPVELDDPRWLPNSYRRAHASYLNPLVEEFTQRYVSAGLVATLQTAGVPCLPVQNPVEFMSDEHVQAREFFGPVDHEYLGTYQQPSFPLMVDGSRMPRKPPPTIGQHTGRLLAEKLGMSAPDIRALEREGIVRLAPSAS